MEPAEVGVGRALRHLNVGDDRRAVEQVVEDQQGIDNHQNGVGQVAVIRRWVRQGFDASDDIVAEVADGPAGKARQAGHLHRRMPAHRAGQMVQRRHIQVHYDPSGLAGPAGTLSAAVPEHLLRVGGEEGVPRPPLAPFK
jgi:hypothetical protein